MTSPAPPPAFLSLSAVWADCARMLRANAGLLTAVAGVFLFLPIVLLARFSPPMEPVETLPAFVEQMQAYVEQAWPWILGTSLANMVGTMTIYLLLLAEPRLTVGGAVMRALPALPFFYILSFLWGLGVGFGVILFLVPAVYLTGKLALAFPILTVERPYAPLSAIRDSWRTARGANAWAIAILIIAVYLAATLVGRAVLFTIGSVLLLALGAEGLGGLLADLLSGLIQAAIAVVGAVLYSAIYRAMRSPVTLAKA